VNGIASAPRQSFDTAPEIFAGVSFLLHNDTKSSLDTIANFTQVLSVSPVRTFNRTVYTKKQRRDIDWENVAKSSLGKRALTLGTDTMTTHIMT
jgi:hypothetical protein